MFDMRGIFKDLDSSFRAIFYTLICCGVVLGLLLVGLGAWLF